MPTKTLKLDMTGPDAKGYFSGELTCPLRGTMRIKVHQNCSWLHDPVGPAAAPAEQPSDLCEPVVVESPVNAWPSIPAGGILMPKGYTMTDAAERYARECGLNDLREIQLEHGGCRIGKPDIERHLKATNANP